MVVVNYEEMTMAKLKEECVKRNLGTGRSKQDLIDKLEKDDEAIKKLAEMSEEELDELMKKGEPVEIIPAPSSNQNVYVDTKGSKLFSVYFPHMGPLLDTEHNDYRMRTRHLAVESGLEPYGGLYAARLNRVENGYLYYEIEVK